MKKEENKIMFDNKKISNQLIESFVKKNNLIALKTLFYIARAEINIPQTEITTIELDSKKLCEYCNIDIKTLKRNIKQMTETSISINDKKYESYVCVIPKASFVVGTTKIEIKIFKEILELIWNVEKCFTVIDIKELMKLTSKHSVKMIQILEMIKGFNVAKRKNYTLEELNMLFSTNYKTLKQFEVEILKKVKDELDLNSKISFIYQTIFKENPKGKGRPVAERISIDLKLHEI